MTKRSVLKGIIFLILALAFLPAGHAAKEKTKKDEKDKKEVKKDSILNSGLVSGLKFRSIGPAFTSGRIADFAVNPANHNEWYVAVASGHIWKTVNNGVTFEPIFDNNGPIPLAAWPWILEIPL
jgi:hypothetical protein